MDTQIVVTRELDEAEHLWLRSLTDNINVDMARTALVDREAKGRAEDSETALLTSILNLMKNMSLSEQDAMKALGIATKDKKRLVTML